MPPDPSPADHPADHPTDHAALPWHAIPAPPAEVHGTTVLVRLVDGLGFRYRWATENLREADANFRPVEGAMSLRELLRHVARLAAWAREQVEGAGATPAKGHAAGTAPSPAGDDLGSLRRATLADLSRLRRRLEALDDDALARVTIANSQGPLPFWNLVNGPLADALTHVGQIASWRRMAGDPGPKADVFRGRPPAG